VAHKIAVNSDIQEKLQNKIEVLKDTNGQPFYEAINRIKYLNTVINDRVQQTQLCGADP